MNVARAAACALALLSAAFAVQAAAEPERLADPLEKSVTGEKDEL